MNLVLDKNNYDVNNVFFYEPVKNTVMDDSKFIRIIYSDEHIILNGLYLKLEKNSKDISKILEIIEKDILNKYIISKNNLNKNKCNKIKEQLTFLQSKNVDTNLILKISGIWETNMSIGLTYKFISV